MRRTLLNRLCFGREGAARYTGSSYRARAVHFDGSVWGKCSELVSDSPYGLMSVWIKQTTPNNVTQFIGNANADLQLAAGYYDAEAEYPSYVFADLYNAANTDWLIYTKQIDDLSSWRHILISYDTNHARADRIIQVYVTDVEVTATPPAYAKNEGYGAWPDGGGGNDPFTVEETLFRTAVFANFYTDAQYDANTPYTAAIADIADLWFDQSYLDISEVSNRRKFISASGMPVFLGSNGQAPLGTVPLFYFSGDKDTFLINKGTGPTVTQTGVLTNASSPPC